MNHITGALRPMLVLALMTGCAGEDGGSDLGFPDVDTVGTASAGRPDSLSGSAPGAADYDDRGGPDAAVAAVRDYYAALAADDYARAYAYWANRGEASGQTFAEFENGFAQTATVAVQVGTPGRIEPAAGSRYIRIPVTVRATTNAGAPQCFRGTYTLRRSVVTGATAEQQQWRIASADLQRRNAGECAGVPLGRAPTRPPP